MNTDNQIGRSVATDGPSNATDGRMPADVMAAGLALSLWVACGSFALALVDGLGPNPTRRFGIGLLLVCAGVAVLLMRSAVCARLRARPWLTILAAGLLLAVIAVDGIVGSPYVAVSLTPIGITVIVARARTVWLCVSALMAGYAFVVLAGHTPAQLSRDGQLGTVAGALVGYPVTGILLLGLRRRFTRFVDRIEPTLGAIRDGSPASTPALARALRADRIELTPAPPLAPVLTPTERRVVEGLATGLTAKQLAFNWGVSINTVRSHISSAKRKTGARTLRELAGMPAHPDWLVRADR